MAPPVAGAPAGCPCLSPTFAWTCSAGLCLVRPPWLPERKELVPETAPPASGRGGRVLSWGIPAAPAGLGRGAGLLRNAAPGWAARPRPSFPYLVLGFACPEGGQLPSRPRSVGRTHRLQLGACALMSVRPVTIRYTTLGESFKLSQPLFSHL